MKAVEIKSTRDYIPLCDRDEPAEAQTVFELKQLSPKEESLLDNMIGSFRGEGMDMRIGDQQLLALNMGLVGIRNFQDSEGNEVKIVREKAAIHGFVKPIKDEVLALIPKDVRAELAQEIMANGQISEDEAKN